MLDDVVLPSRGSPRGRRRSAGNTAQAHREALKRGLTQTEGIDMAAALHDFIGMGEGTGRSQAERMKRYGLRA